MGGGSDSRDGGRGRIDDEAKEAFLASVRGGARLEEAAKAVGCSLPGLYAARARDVAFEVAWIDALAFSAAAERSGPRGEARIASNNRRMLQRRQMRHVRFTAERKEIFLAELAAACDVEAAAEAAGVDASTVYKHRRKDADFAAAFQEALEQGYARLEAEALRQRLAAQRRMGEAIDRADPAGRPTPADEAAEFERVMKLLDRWTRRGGRPGPRTVSRAESTSMPVADALAELERRLAAIGIAVRHEPGDDERPEPR
jgi:hypothetical protein